MQFTTEYTEITEVIKNLKWPNINLLDLSSFFVILLPCFPRIPW